MNHHHLPSLLIAAALTTGLYAQTGSPGNIRSNRSPSLTVCFDTVTTVNARPQRLKGGVPEGGVWTGPGIIKDLFYPLIAGPGIHTVTYTYTFASGSITTTSWSVHVLPEAPFTCGNLVTDVRDNRQYRTFLSGSQCWMAENLNYGTRIGHTAHQRDNCVTEKFCLQDNDAFCAGSGGLYQWDELMRYEEDSTLRDLCPPGWKVPGEQDWDTLFLSLGGKGLAGLPMRQDGGSGFDELLTGAGFQNTLWAFYPGSPVLNSSLFWSSAAHGYSRAWGHGINRVVADTEFTPSVNSYPSLRNNGFAVRCIRASATPPGCPGTPAITFGGQTYGTIQVGAQCWMAQNLNIGTRITGTSDQTDNGILEKYCMRDLEWYCNQYGGLYQWDEMMQYVATAGAQGICPPGWHLPSDAEWCTLTTFLDPTVDCSATGLTGLVAGGLLKEAGTRHWDAPNTGATNESGFTALGSGYRRRSKDFGIEGSSTYFWTSTECTSGSAWYRGLGNDVSGIYRYGTYYDKTGGFSVRCIQGADSLSLVPPAVVTGAVCAGLPATATGGGEVTSQGGSPVVARGVCWSTDTLPTVLDNHTTDGSGTGLFLSTLSGLQPCTGYHVRAYATNTGGTAYGSDLTFTSAGDSIHPDQFTGTQLDTLFWHIKDLTGYHEPGMDLYVNDSLFIVRGLSNDNNGWLGVETNQELPCFRSAKIDFWLPPEHNWQDHKIRMATPVGSMGYYNFGSYWWYDYYQADGTYHFILINAGGYLPNHKYAFRISVTDCTLKFEWDSGSGFQTVYQTTDYSAYHTPGQNVQFRRVDVTSSDKGVLKCDNFELQY